jgi:phosphatidylglycerophosphate synthase
MGPRTFKPSMWGKMTTAALILTSVIVMYFNYLGETSILVDVGIWVSFGLTAISAADYFVRLRLLINEPPPPAST